MEEPHDYYQDNINVIFDVFTAPYCPGTVYTNDDLWQLVVQLHYSNGYAPFSYLMDS